MFSVTTERQVLIAETSGYFREINLLGKAIAFLARSNNLESESIATSEQPVKNSPSEWRSSTNFKDFPSKVCISRGCTNFPSFSLLTFSELCV